MNWNTRITLLTALLAAPSLAQQSVQPPYSSNGMKERPCSNERFTLEVPLGAPAFVPTFETVFASVLVIDPAWFCSSGASCASTHRAVLTAALPARPWAIPVERRDGDRRSYLLNFQTWSGKEWIDAAPLPERNCEVVSRLRDATAKAQGIKTPSSPVKAAVLVSRSCGVVVQDVEAHALTSTVEWADSRIAARPTSPVQGVEVALVDTGVPDKYWLDVGVNDEEKLPSYERTSGEFHPHGTHMAALIHAVAPHAKITSFRALDEYGMGSLSALAHATDEALFRSGASRGPLVVNLSVGAPPTLFTPSSLTSVWGCNTWEDPAGEALRYVLHLATMMDAAGPAVFVAASSGNLPLEKIAQNDLMGALPITHSRCGATTSNLASSFFPASLGELQSCYATTPTWLGVQPVGASDYDDAASSLTIQSANVRLYAPGERVYAHGPRNSVDLDFSCLDVSLDKGFQLPAAVSGTSAATALVSASAAHLLGRVPWAGQRSTPRAAEISRLLYLTGQPMCSGPKARRIHLGRADDAVVSTTPGCRQLVDCLVAPGHPSGPALSDSTGYLCQAAMNNCFGATAELACPLPQKEPGWTRAALDQVPLADATCRATWNASYGAPSPHLLGVLSRYSGQQLAGIGPQPSGTACPSCSIIVDPTLMTVRFELSDAFPSGTVFTDAYVALLSSGKDVKYFIPVTDGRSWRPGEVGQMVLDLSRVSDDPHAIVEMMMSRELIPVLDIAEKPRRGEESRNLSPLAVERP